MKPVPSPFATGVLLERGEEMELIGEALRAARDGGGSLTLIEGPAGIGKTELLLSARDQARAASMDAAVARASELERERPFGAVRQLLEPLLAAASAADRVELLSESAALASPIFAPESQLSGPEEGDRTFASIQGLYWLCVNLLQRRPLLLALDDGQWADLASLRFLAHLAQRRDGLPLALLVTARPAEGAPAEDLLVRLATDPRATVLAPAPLSEAAIASLLGAELGVEAEAAFVGACRTSTGGTPFLLRELIWELRERRLSPLAAHSSEVIELGPRSVARAVVARIQRLSPQALALARAAAVLGRDGSPHLLARLAGLDDAVAADACDALAAEGVIGDGWPVQFVHPILRSSLYSNLHAGERSALHAEAARLLAADGAPDEQIAEHLLPTAPKGRPETVTLLLGIARAAIARGAGSSAAAYLQRALAEPPSAKMRAEVLQELGRAEAMEGRGLRFREAFAAAIAAAQADPQRARIGLEFGRALASAGDFATASEVFISALEALDGDEDPLAVALESELFTIGRGDSIRARFRRRLAQLEAGELEHPTLIPPLALWLASTKAPASLGAEVAERAARESAVEVNSVIPAGVGNALLLAGRLKRADQVYRRSIVAARRNGSRMMLAWTSAFRARVRIERGEVAAAVVEARLGFDLLGEAAADGTSSGRLWAFANLLESLLAAGQQAEAEVVLAAGEGEGVFDGPASYARALAFGGRGRLRLSQGRPGEALEDALASAELTPPNPAARPWRSDAATALQALDRGAEGAELAAEELAAARAFAVPHAIAPALRALARCSGPAAALDLRRQAVEVLDGSEARLEMARSLVDLGAALRRQGERREAQERLRRGLDLAHRCNAAFLAGRAREELLAAGARPRRTALSGAEALTPSERRVAELAAAGLTNRDIALELFVTPRTVEGHLTQVFRKLEIESRHQIAGLLGDSAAD
jgi:DNA-binding CsgD family transcriptional regulator